MTTNLPALLLIPAVMLGAPQVRAQSKAPVPFHASAFSPTVDLATLDGVFSQEIPVGKRLVVQHISLIAFGVEITKPLVLANCMVHGNGLDVSGNPQDVSHFIPLTNNVDLPSRTAQLTGGGPLTMQLEAGPISVTCSSGTGGQKLVFLEAHLSGELTSR